jgi:large subunit ribosomal protein L20
MLKKAKGYRGRRSKLFRYAKDALMEGAILGLSRPQNSKRTFSLSLDPTSQRRARANGMTYSRLAEGLKAAGIGLDRKIPRRPRSH